MSRRARAPDVRRAGRGAGRAAPRDRARRRAVRHGAEPRAPAVARALPADRPADSHREHPAKHPGDRPIGEYLELARARGLPAASSATASFRPCRSSRAGSGGTRRGCAGCTALLTRLLPVPGWCFLNVLRFDASLTASCATGSSTSQRASRSTARATRRSRSSTSLLLAVYVKGGFLTTVDYGALALIGAIEAFAKVISRWGLDGAFMRYYHERGRAACRGSGQHDRLVSCSRPTASCSASRWLARRRARRRDCFDDPATSPALRLMLVNTFAHRLHVRAVPRDAHAQRGAPPTARFTFARSVGTLVLRIVLRDRAAATGWRACTCADLVVTVVAAAAACGRGSGRSSARRSRRDDLRHGAALRPAARCRTDWRSRRSTAATSCCSASYIAQAQLGVYQNARHARHRRQVLHERVRDGVGAVLLRDVARARREDGVRAR